MNHGKLVYPAFILVAVLGAVSGAIAWKAMQQEPSPPEQPALLVLPEPRDIPGFALVDQDGEAFGPDRLGDAWSLLFFGFTHCPDVCPGALFDLQKLGERLDDGNFETPYRVVFFSVDPERDTPERLKDYTAYFDPDFLAVTGDHEELLPLTRSLGIAYRIEDHEPGAAAYSVDHSASILLVNPEGRLHGVFPAPHDVPAMEAELLKLMN